MIYRVISLSRWRKEWDGVVIHWVRRVPTRADFMAVGRQFIAALYGQPAGISMTQARYNICTHKQEKLLHIMAYHVSAINRHDIYLHMQTGSFKYPHLKILVGNEGSDSARSTWMDGCHQLLARRPTIAVTKQTQFLNVLPLHSQRWLLQSIHQERGRGRKAR